MSTWNTSAASYTDISTPDLNGSTSAAVFSVDVDVPTQIVRLKLSVSSGTFTVTVGTQIVF
jgi:hypothetical protein